MWVTFLYTTITLFVIRILYEARRDRGLPPGPRRLPLIGNLHQAPTHLPWLTYHKWFQQWGPIISLQLGGSTVVILGSASVAHDLLNKRSGIYSDRPRLVMAGDCMTKGMHTLMRPYNDRYLLHQRMDAAVVSPRAAATYTPLQDLESKQLLANFVRHAAERPGAPADFGYAFELYSYSVSYMAGFGIRITSEDPQHIADAKRVIENMAYACQPGAWIVDALPFLNSLPRALAPWKKTADALFGVESTSHARNVGAGLKSKSWNWAKELRASKEAQEMSDLEFAYNVGILVDAGLETTSAVLEVFMLACLAQPRFVELAQRELDEVVGRERLPGFADRESLPYVRACVEETLRWRHIAPGGIPHATLEEDHYMGYRIPKGAVVPPVYWSMHLEEDVYSSPWSFQPERWLGQPEGKSFGFGRRICAGRFVARNSLFIMIARLLWAFNIKHAVDRKTGRSIEVDDKAFGNAVISKPHQFSAVFEPRTERHREIVEEAWDKQEKDADVLLNGIRNHQIAIGLNIRSKT
ncbi:Cytochrome P450 [Macrophomina phaseolina MS6]|uniref:Cytochrome P450 n=1 Tax=Macrophomina phaseolina (strain MS6) TaxID=1126212 RepID=K2RE99_MACPH|nr:Cytochrome P450 [Macrophomina phaseolina MS6]